MARPKILNKSELANKKIFVRPAQKKRFLNLKKKKRIPYDSVLFESMLARAESEIEQIIQFQTEE